VIAADDRIELAPDVSLRGRELVDDVRSVAIELSETAAIAARQGTPARMATALAARFDVDHVLAVADARTFCSSMNRALLANVQVGALRLLVRWIVGAATLAPGGRLPSWPPRRYTVSTHNVRSSCATIVRGARGAATAVAATIAFPLLLIDPALAATAGATAATGLVLHELGHALALRRIPAALVVRAMRVALLHRRLSPSREAVVAAAGPLVPVLAAVALLGLVGETCVLSALCVPPLLAVHALALTVLGSDGRKICAAC